MICKKCNQEKTKQDYGYARYICKSCVAAYTREYRKKNKNYLAQMTGYNQKIKAEVLAHYSPGGVPQCQCCKEQNLPFLELEHARWNEPAGSQNFYRKIKKLGYPEGARVICANCHKAIIHWGKCPHPLGLSKGDKQ